MLYYMNKGYKLSLVSPCYNEQDNVKLFYETVIDRIKNTIFENSYEIIFINDGSRDETYKRLSDIFNENKSGVKVINFLHNFGKEAAILAGLKQATGDFICVIDSDCQQDPKYAVEMAEILINNNEFDMVAAKPSNEKDSKLLSFFKSSFYKIINKISSVPFYRGVSDFRVFRKHICDAIISLTEHDRFSKGIFSWVCPEIKCIEYEVKKRNSGTTKWSFFKLLKYAFNGIFSFSYTPLSISLITMLLEFIVSIVFLVLTIVNSVSYGFNLFYFVLFLLFGISGLHSLSSWINSQYIAKIHREVSMRPLYIIKNILEGENL